MLMQDIHKQRAYTETTAKSDNTKANNDFMCVDIDNFWRYVRNIPSRPTRIKVTPKPHEINPQLLKQVVKLI